MSDSCGMGILPVQAIALQEVYSFRDQAIALDYL